MRQTARHTQPPSIAAWLVELFASADHAETLLGDLSEGFSDIALKSGVLSARGWYWRQSTKTIFHLAGVAFRKAPWSIAGAVFLGFVLRRLGFSLLVAVVRMQRPYANLHFGLMTADILIARLLEMTFIGCIVAAVAKRREIIATIVLITASATVFGFVAFLFMRNLPSQMPWIFLLRNFENWIAILLGSILVRVLRSASQRQHPTP